MGDKLLRHWQIRCVGSFPEDMDADQVFWHIQERIPQLGMFDVIPLEEEMKHAGTVEGRLGALERSERTLNRCMHEAFQRITALEGRSHLFGSWSPAEALKRAGVKVKGDEDPPRTNGVLQRIMALEDKVSRLIKIHQKELKQLKDDEELELQRDQGM